MQLMPATATYIADKMKIPTYNLNTPTDNIRFGVIHFNYLYKTLGILKGVASYNCGQGALGKFKKHNDIDLFLENIPKSETRLYVKKVMKSYWNYNLLYNKSATPQILF